MTAPKPETKSSAQAATPNQSKFLRDWRQPQQKTSGAPIPPKTSSTLPFRGPQQSRQSAMHLTFDYFGAKPEIAAGKEGTEEGWITAHGQRPNQFQSGPRLTISRFGSEDSRHTPWDIVRDDSDTAVGDDWESKEADATWDKGDPQTKSRSLSVGRGDAGSSTRNPFGPLEGRAEVGQTRFYELEFPLHQPIGSSGDRDSQKPKEEDEKDDPLQEKTKSEPRKKSKKKDKDRWAEHQNVDREDLRIVRQYI